MIQKHLLKPLSIHILFCNLINSGICGETGYSVPPSELSAPIKAEETQNKYPSQPGINLTLYRDEKGTALATKKLMVRLKSGRQSVLYEHTPKTLNLSSVAAALEDSNTARILEHYLSGDSQELAFEISSDKEQERVVSLTYLFTGVKWDISYSCMLSPDQKNLILSGWIEVSNESGVGLENAQLFFDGGGTKASPDGGITVDHAKSDFHYILPRILSLPKGKKVYIDFISASRINLRQENLLNLGNYLGLDLNREKQSLQIQRVVEFKNDVEAGLNATLPEGKVTIYQQTSHKGLNEFVGHSFIQETPLSSTVALRIGDYFRNSGVTCVLEQTDYKKTTARSSEGGYRLFISNKGSSNFLLKVVLPFPDCDWTVVRTSHEYVTESQQNLIYWLINVPAGQDMELKYRIKLDNMKVPESPVTSVKMQGSKVLRE